jgi:hypothetical protein
MRGVSVSYRTDHSYAVEDETYDEADDEPRRGLLSWILIVALLLGTGSGSALIWRTFGGGSLVPSPGAGRVSVAAAEKPTGQPDLTVLRQEITGSVQSTHQLLAAQQAEIKRLSEQVSALSNKLELMQRPVASAQAAIPVPAPKAVAPAAKKKPDAPKPVAAKPADAKPAEAKPNGGISTGGAPLQFSR